MFRAMGVYAKHVHFFVVIDFFLLKWMVMGGHQGQSKEKTLEKKKNQKKHNFDRP
jgi:hypothetical protein